MRIKLKWIVIYRGQNKGDYSRCSIPLTKPTAETLFDTKDAEYLVKIKKVK